MNPNVKVYELFWNNENMSEAFGTHGDAMEKVEELKSQGITEIYLAHMTDDGEELDYENF